MSGKLKPCPFCGSGDIELVVTDTPTYHYRCRSCRCSTAHKGMTKDAAEAWNRRVKSSEPCGSPEAEAHDVPHHYEGDGSVTCADAMRSMTWLSTLPPMQLWWWACAFKYLWRWPWKNGAEDLRKAHDCIGRLLKEAGE